MSAVADTRGHDLSVANSVEHDAPDFKHAKHLRVGNYPDARPLLCDALARTRWVRRLVGAGLYSRQTDSIFQQIFPSLQLTTDCC